MPGTRRCLVAIVAAGVILAAAAATMAETCTLVLKRRESNSINYADRTSYMYWSGQPQYFYLQMNEQGGDKSRPALSGDPSQAAAFKRIVKKEPKYQSAHPFRGVVKFGSQEYAFALDVAAPKPDPKAKKPEAKETAAKPAGDPSADSETSSPLGRMFGWLLGIEPQPPAEPAPAKAAIPVRELSYSRLYFDFNHNGDLTDDKVIELPAESQPGERELYGTNYASFEFPRIDVKIDVDGTKVDHSFFLQGRAISTTNYCNVYVSVSSAVCREGDITLAGKRHHLVLLDYNSNGRFDDQTKISGNIHLANGQLYPEQGDMLLVDPKIDDTSSDSPYDPTASDFRHYVSKMISIDGRWYDLKVSPAGDKLTLTPSTVALGKITNRNESFTAVIYGERGFLRIHGAKDTPISVPEGQWKLFSYTITQAAVPRPVKPAAKAGTEKTTEAKPAKKGSLAGFLSNLLLGETTIREDEESETAVARPSVVSATATDKYKAVTVRKGETVELPFGPPYTPTVTAMSYPGLNVQAEQLSLAMTLVGVGGEACTNMSVAGGRPGKPNFTITDPKGKVIQQGSFEYG
jgi:hypothetical protein